MAFTNDSERLRERREEERLREREEQRRQEALESRQEEERQRQREEERRQEALRQAREFEVALETAHRRREALLARIRAQSQAERRESLREKNRRAALLETLRMANRQERREVAKESERLEATRQRRIEARRKAQQETERDAERRTAARQGRLGEQREAERKATLKAERAAAREARQEKAQAVDRTAEDRTTRREENRARQQESERREALRQKRLEEQREEQRRAEQDAERRAAARQGRLEEQREAERKATLKAERRSSAQEQQSQAPRHDPLQDRITSGVLSGSLPWLRVTGNKIATLSGAPIVLRGVSLLGLDSAEPDPERGFAAGAGITEAVIDAILDWGASVVRLSINRSRVLHGYGRWNPWEYMADLDWIIRRAAAGGAYTLLSLRRLDDFTVFGTLPSPEDERSLNFIAPQPDYDTIGMWRMLAERYAEEPAVLFDLFSSPHSALEDDLTGFDTNWSQWTLWVRLLVADLRRMHPRALCFVSGLDWATDLSGFPVIGTGGKPIPNLIYASHLSTQQDDPLPRMRSLAQEHPVFVTEWGGMPLDTAGNERVALAMWAEGTGWIAAHWNAQPFLVQPAGRNFSPTRFGAVVRRALAMSDQRAEGSLPTVPDALDH